MEDSYVILRGFVDSTSQSHLPKWSLMLFFESYRYLKSILLLLRDITKGFKIWSSSKGLVPSVVNSSISSPL